MILLGLSGATLIGNASQSLVSSPARADAAPGQTITFTASNGTQPYHWSAPGGTPNSPIGPTYSVSFASTGTFQVTVMDSTGDTFFAQVVNGNIPAPTSTPKPTPPPCAFTTPPPTPPHFGYVDDACDGLEYVLPQTAGETNTAWSNRTADLTPVGIADAQIQDMCAASHSGRLCVLEIGEVAFTGSNGATLRSDWRARIDQWANAISPNIQYVAAIYPLDEPMERANNAGVPFSTMLTNLTLVTNEIKSLFPNTPLAVIVQGLTLTQSLPLPLNYDWIGVDFFTDFFNGGQGLVCLENILESRLTATQRAILVLFAWANPGTTERRIGRVQQATEYYGLTLAAANHPKIIGAFPFLFQSVAGSPLNALGVRDIPALHAIYKTISADFLSR